MTISERRVLSVFIASPGDVGEERAAARRLVDETNRSLRSLGWQIDLLGWEDTLPGRARPQELINEDVRQCHLFIGVLSHRWGSPTGKYSSGFEEEYELARSLARDNSEPEIWLFLRSLDADRLADPGEQLAQVLAFRKRLQDEREVLYKEYDNVDELVAQLRDALLRYVFSLMTGGGEGEAAQQPPAVAPEVVADSLEPEGDVSQAVAALRRVSSALESGNPINALDAARVRLASAAVFSAAYVAEGLSSHVAHLLFSSIDDLILTDQEQHTVLRSILAGWDVVPGWRLLADAGVHFIVSAIGRAAAFDYEQRVRLAALKMLQLSGVSPLVQELEGFDIVPRALRDKSTSVVEAAVEYVMSTVDDVAAVKSFAELLPSTSAHLSARMLRRVDPVAAVRLLISRKSKIPSEDLALFSEVAPELTEDDLRQASQHRVAAVRAYGVRELARRMAIPADALHGMMEDKSHVVRREVATALVEMEGTSYEEAENIIRRVDPERPWGEDWLTRRALDKLDAEKLVDKMFFGDMESHEAYGVLGRRNDYRVSARLRADLADGFESLYQESVARLEPGSLAQKYLSERMADVLDYWKSEYVGVALTLLDQDSIEGDEVLARQYLPAEYSFVEVPAIRILGKHGNAEEDAPLLLAAARQKYGEARDAAIEALLALDPDVSAAAGDLLNSGDPVLCEAALFRLVEVDPPRALAAAKNLTLDERSAIRALGVAAIIAVVKIDESLREILADYQRRSEYYYDVVVWLDTALDAPGGIRDGFREALLRDRSPV